MKCISILSENLNFSRVDNSQSNISLSGQSLLVLLCVEEGDNDNDIQSMTARLKSFLEADRPKKLPVRFDWPMKKITILPFSHLSEFSSRNKKHVHVMLKRLCQELSSSHYIHKIEPRSTNSVFINLAMFDTVFTSRLSITKQSIRNNIKAWLRVFNADTISQVLEEVKKGEKNE